MRVITNWPKKITLSCITLYFVIATASNLNKNLSQKTKQFIPAYQQRRKNNGNCFIVPNSDYW